jgi:hypothetical protein
VSRADRAPREDRATVSATVSITCLTDGRAHDVPEVQIAGSEGGGHLVGLCGHVVVAASLVEPAGAPCRRCAVL